jgi:hypothetical protein
VQLHLRKLASLLQQQRSKRSLFAWLAIRRTAQAFPVSHTPHVRALFFFVLPTRDEMMHALGLGSQPIDACTQPIEKPTPNRKTASFPVGMHAALVLRQLATDGDAGRTGEGSTRSIYMTTQHKKNN